MYQGTLGPWNLLSQDSVVLEAVFGLAGLGIWCIFSMVSVQLLEGTVPGVWEPYRDGLAGQQ